MVLWLPFKNELFWSPETSEIMHELTYTSVAKKNLSSEDLNDILNTAKAFNKTHSITGCLVYHNNQFVQTLHGDKKVIFELLEKIKVDKRHAHVNLVWDGPSEKEVFSGWHMAFYAPNLETNKDSLVDFEKNLVTLSSFYESDSASVRIFWSIVKDLCLDEAKTSI